MTQNNDKLFIITRQDISPGYQAVQSVHGMRQWVEEHPEEDDRWFKESNYIALLSVPTENDLVEMIKKASSQGVKFSVFQEPDIDNAITAIVLEPGKKSKKLCRGLPLALEQI